MGSEEGRKTIQAYLESRGGTVVDLNEALDEALEFIRLVDRCRKSPVLRDIANNDGCGGGDSNFIRWLIDFMKKACSDPENLKRALEMTDEEKQKISTFLDGH